MGFIITLCLIAGICLGITTFYALAYYSGFSKIAEIIGYFGVTR